MSQSNVHVSSAVSHIINAAIAETGDESLRSNAATRLDIQMQVESIVESVIPDRTDWVNVKEQFEYYDKYIAARRASNEVTDFDLVRPGLHATQFTSHDAFEEHKARVKGALQSSKGNTKVCSACGQEKLKTAFRATGSVCNACRSRRYRERKAERS